MADDAQTQADREHGELTEWALGVMRSRTGNFAFRFIVGLINLFLRPFLRCRIEGLDNLKTPGPLVVAPVHRSNLDAALLGSASPRRLLALAKDSMFKRRRGPGWVFAALGSYPVRRGAADRDALATSQELLEQGEALLVFPEGTRGSGPELGELFDGPAFLAARARAKVVPVGIAGTEEALPSGAKFLRRRRVTIIVGEPMDPPGDGTGRVSLPARRRWTAELSTELQRLFDVAIADAGAYRDWTPATDPEETAA